MSELRVETLTAGDREVRALTKGDGPKLLLMAHTGVPGLSPFCGSADLFAGLITALELPGFRIVAPDLPGAGATVPRQLEELTADGVAAFLDQLLGTLPGVEEVHLLAHGEASLAALKLAREGVAAGAVASAFLLAPNAPAPIGDSIQNVSLLNPPLPRWQQRSLRWAVRRLAYFPDRFPPEQLERMAAHAGGEAHRAAVELLRDPVNGSALFGSQLRAQDEFYAFCRDHGYELPLTVFWGAGDLTATVARGAVLAEILSGGSGPLDFQLVNQCGHFGQFDRHFQLLRVLEASLERTTSDLLQHTKGLGEAI